MAAALMPERERSVTPLAMPMSRVRPSSWQLSGLTDGVPHAHVADLRRMHGEVHPAAAGLCGVHYWSGASVRSASPLAATKVSVSSGACYSSTLRVCGDRASLERLAVAIPS